MDEIEKHAAHIRQEHGGKAFEYIAKSRLDAIMQRDTELIDYWERVMKAYQRAS